MIDSISTIITATFCNGPTINPEPQQPQRTWVGLDADEVFELASGRWTLGQMAVLVEAKLKDKNT